MWNFLRNAGDSPFVLTNWTSPAGVESAKSKNGKEVSDDSEEHDASTTQTTRREFVK
jgi:hypothetical protein